MTSPLVRLRSSDLGPLSVTGLVGVGSERVGASPASRLRRPITTFDDVSRRAERLIVWSEEETIFLARHDVRNFSSDDRAGRDLYAYEALYQLLPRLRQDIGRLRAACGPGVMTTTVTALGNQAGAAVQIYVTHWERLRDL